LSSGRSVLPANISGPNYGAEHDRRRVARLHRQQTEADVKGGMDLTRRSRKSSPIVKEYKKILFNGNGYGEEWHKEAAQAWPAEPQEHHSRFCR